MSRWIVARNDAGVVVDQIESPLKTGLGDEVRGFGQHPGHASGCASSQRPVHE
jgi:hypothetical protein